MLTQTQDVDGPRCLREHRRVRSTVRRIAAAALAATAIAAAVTIQAEASPTATPAASAVAHAGGPAGTNDFRGVNWADPRDNYADDAVVPTGLSVADDYATVVPQGRRHRGAASATSSAPTPLRLPINPASVGTAWWNSYRGDDRRGDRAAASRSSSATGRPTTPRTAGSTTRRLEQRCGTRWSPTYAQEPARLLRADERAVRLHASTSGCRSAPAGSPGTPTSRAAGSSSAAPATTTTSPASAPRPRSTARCCRCTSTASGPATRPRPTGSPTCCRGSARTPTARSSTRPARR